MSLQELVHEFNNLRRSPRTPSESENHHWHFSVRYIPLEPPKYVLHIVNPARRVCTGAEGPGPILSRGSVGERAETVLLMLLEVFSHLNKVDEDTPASGFAPWSWGTDDFDLAKALEVRLKAVGVRKELCNIRVGDKASDRTATAMWEAVLERLKVTKQFDNMTTGKCAKCKKPPPDEARLLWCCNCEKAIYCDKTCQKAHWKDHKIICRISAIDYWTVVVPNASDAKAMAAGIGLELGFGGGGLRYPIRRLVVTGKDTPENFRKLLGWNDKDTIRSTHYSSRVEVLLGPSQGSNNWATAKSLKLDDNSPPWTPRPASGEEERKIHDIRDMQKLIRHYMGSRSMENITCEDMQDILMSNFASEWRLKLATYQDAVDNMDRGIHV